MLKPVGFFDELELWHPTGQSLVDNLSTEPRPKEAEIIRYLEDGNIIVACAGIVEDVLSKSGEFAGVPSIKTDGVFVWTGILGYYVKKYHAVLPDEFIQHIEANNWQMPELSESEILEISEQFYNENTE